MLLNQKKLEALLVSKWTEFLDTRELLALTKRYASDYLDINDPKITQLIITRFEPVREGFIIWLEYSASDIKATSEIFLSNEGILTHIRTV